MSTDAGQVAPLPSQPPPIHHPTVFDEATGGLARTYADALVNAAQKDGQVDEVLDELDEVWDEVLGRNPILASWLSSPQRSVDDKDALIVKAFEGRATPTTVRFLRVLNRHDRFGLLGPVVRAARATWDARQGRRPVTVRSAVPLDDGQQDALRARLAGFVGGTPVLSLVVDPSLIGGLVIQVGDNVYDASVRNRLEQLRQRLLEGKTHEIQSRRDHFRYSE